MTLPLSVLDLIPLPAGGTAGEALEHALDLARHVETLGYTRLWYAEHHNMSTIVSTSPEILCALAAQATGHIRVGSGGVMLPNHAPLRIAEAYKLLEALAPDRIDLGIGRAPGTDPAAARALRGPQASLQGDDFAAKLAELMAYGQGPIPPGNPQAGVAAMPADVPLPPIYLLGSSEYSADLAAALGLGYGFAAHFSDLPPEGPMLAYRRAFAAQGRFPAPHAILTLSVICAETTEAAERLAAPLIVAFTRLRSGQKSTLLSPEEALRYPFTPMERAVADTLRRMHIIGTPDFVKARILAFASRTQADEVMITTFAHGHADRLRSYALVAGAFGLPSAG